MRCPLPAALVLVSAPLARAQEPMRPAPTVAWTTEIDSPSFGGAAVADVDGDGRLEVAFGTYFGDDSVRVLNGEDGSEYWRFDVGNACLDASLRFADVDGDDTLELIVPVSNKGWILALDAKSGDELWRYAPDPVECTDSPPTITDVDGDGTVEIVYGTFRGRLHVVSSAGERERVYDVCEHFIQTGPTIVDLDGDGVRDYACATFKGDNRIYAVSGDSGAELWHVDVPGDHIGMYHGASSGDLDGDGVPELVIAAYDGVVRCLRGKDGEVLWDVAPGDRYFMSPTVIADLDGDGAPEVIAASEKVSVIDADGSVRWSKRCNKRGWDAVTRGVSVADLDGDDRLDVVTLSGNGLLRVFRGLDGELLYEFDAAEHTSRPVQSSSHGVTIADLTGDGKLDLFFVVGATQPDKHGLAVCLTGFEGEGRGWYMLRHDPENSGNVKTPLDPVLLRHVEGLRPADDPVMRPALAPKVRANEEPARPAARLDRASVFDLAKERGIEEAAVEAASAANRPGATTDELDAVEDFDDEGFAAACLLIETGNSGTYTVLLIERTWKPGREAALLDLCRRDPLPNFGTWTALSALGFADTEEVRDYLLDRLEHETDAGLFMSTAKALGRLEERRALETVGAQILKFEPRWSGVEPHLLMALAHMGGRDANESFGRYLADERSTHFELALRAIARTDREDAARRARALLNSERDLTAQQRAAVERFLP